MSDNILHEKIGSFSADIATLKEGHVSILQTLDKIEEKRDKQFEAIEVKLEDQNKERAKHNKEQAAKFDKMKWGIVGSTITTFSAPFVATSTMGKEVLHSLIVYIEKLFA